MSRKLCSRCKSKVFRRINRRGWLERVMLSKLGVFPWECVHCRGRKFFRDQGHAPRPRQRFTPEQKSVFEEVRVADERRLT